MLVSHHVQTRLTRKSNICLTCADLVRLLLAIFADAHLANEGRRAVRARACKTINGKSLQQLRCHHCVWRLLERARGPAGVITRKIKDGRIPYIGAGYITAWSHQAHFFRKSRLGNWACSSSYLPSCYPQPSHRLPLFPHLGTCLSVSPNPSHHLVFPFAVVSRLVPSPSPKPVSPSVQLPLAV